MSIANILLTKRAGLLVTDTNLFALSGGFIGHGKKVRIFSDSRAAIAGRGPILAMHALWDAYAASPFRGDFANPQAGRHLLGLVRAARAEALDAVNAAAEQASSQSPEACPAPLLDAANGLCATVVAWSEKERRPVAWRIADIDESAQAATGAEPGAHRVPAGVYVGFPGWSGGRDIDWSHNARNAWREQMVEIVDVQREIMSAWGAPLSIGGSLIATIVERDGISQEVIHRYPEATGEGEPMVAQAAQLVA